MTEIQVFKVPGSCAGMKRAVRNCAQYEALKK